MLVYLSHYEWQLLRLTLRAELAKEQPPLGSELRIAPTRATKDGTFLDRMVAAGLIAVAVKAPPLPAGASEREKGLPVQFRTRYKLTEVGRHAAEYGEYDKPHTPTPAPITGTAAELLAPSSSKKPKSKKPKK